MSQALKSLKGVVMNKMLNITAQAVIQPGVVIFLQSIADITSAKRVSSYEALARLRLGDGTYIEPEIFFRSLSTSCLMALDQMVIRQALIGLVEGNKSRTDPVHLHTNVSSATLRDTHFLGFLKEVFSRTGVNPGRLTLEVVEPESFWENPIALGNIRGIRELGVNLAIDDFPNWDDVEGLMVYLRGNPTTFNTLKLDRGLVQQICSHDTGALGRVLGQLVIFKELGLKIVAEGIEHSHQERFMGLIGVDALQGHLIGRPQPMKDVLFLA